MVISALSKGNIPYKVWFGQKPPTNFLNYKESACRAHIALGEREININESSTSE
jgi:hypothetical protein